MLCSHHAFSCHAPPQSLFPTKNIRNWTGISFPGQRREKGGRAYRREPRSAAGRKELMVERVPAEHVHLSEEEGKM